MLPKSSQNMTRLFFASGVERIVIQQIAIVLYGSILITPAVKNNAPIVGCVRRSRNAPRARKPCVTLPLTHPTQSSLGASTKFAGVISSTHCLVMFVSAPSKRIEDGCKKRIYTRAEVIAAANSRQRPPVSAQDGVWLAFLQSLFLKKYLTASRLWIGDRQTELAFSFANSQQTPKNKTFRKPGSLGRKSRCHSLFV